MADSVETSSEEGAALSTVGKGAAWIFGGRIVKLGILFLVEVLMARILGATSYGSIVLAFMIIRVGSTVATLGLAGGLSRKVPQYEDDPSRLRGVIRSSLVLAAIGSAIVAAVAYLMAPFLATEVFGTADTTLLFQLAALGIPFTVIAGVGVAVGQASRDAKPRVIVDQLIQPIGRGLFIPSFIAAGFGAVGALAGAILATAIGALTALYLAIRAIPVAIRGRSSSMYREMFTFSIPLMFSGGLLFLFNNTDTFLIGLFLTEADVGIYTVAFKLQNLGMFFFYPVTFLLPPMIARLETTGAIHEMKRTYQVTTKWMTIPTFLLIALVVMFPGTVIRGTFGNAYSEGIFPLRVLVIPVLVTTLLGANGSTLVALGHNRITMYVNSGLAVLNFGLNLLLIPMFGIGGAAIATSTAMILRDFTYSAALYRWHGMHPFSWAMLRPMVALSPVLVGGYLAVRFAVGTSLWSVLVFAMIATGIYGVAILRLGGIESEDVKVFDRFEDSVGVRFHRLRRFVHWAQS